MKAVKSCEPPMRAQWIVYKYWEQKPLDLEKFKAESYILYSKSTLKKKSQVQRPEKIEDRIRAIR